MRSTTRTAARRDGRTSPGGLDGPAGPPASAGLIAGGVKATGRFFGRAVVIFGITVGPMAGLPPLPLPEPEAEAASPRTQPGADGRQGTAVPVGAASSPGSPMPAQRLEPRAATHAATPERLIPRQVTGSR